jgi:hypothetical protein
MNNYAPAMSDDPTKNVANATNVEVPSMRVGGDHKANSTSFTKESRALAVGANKGEPPGKPSDDTRK